MEKGSLICDPAAGLHDCLKGGGCKAYLQQGMQDVQDMQDVQAQSKE